MKQKEHNSPCYWKNGIAQNLYNIVYMSLCAEVSSSIRTLKIKLKMQVFNFMTKICCHTNFGQSQFLFAEQKLLNEQICCHCSNLLV